MRDVARAIPLWEQASKCLVPGCPPETGLPHLRALRGAAAVYCRRTHQAQTPSEGTGQRDEPTCYYKVSSGCVARASRRRQIHLRHGTRIWHGGLGHVACVLSRVGLLPRLLSIMTDTLRPAATAAGLETPVPEAYRETTLGVGVLGLLLRRWSWLLKNGDIAPGAQLRHGVHAYDPAELRHRG